MKYLLLLAIYLYSCSPYKCYPSKGSRDYGHVRKVKEGWMSVRWYKGECTKVIYECDPRVK